MSDSLSDQLKCTH